ncbi:glutathione S-transferase C-terminal domain-containing protein isoform X2 [Nerophis lumbriciformis]|uniref:glutathione S-transferase C-terminal domain-containing protein isoform X2 n=1 Tax=Nerophis lumbriciformis TaxID=546530 RepID=UPI002ADFC196|nr:glutathione S-transferase C-terminal domain-containing protein-like isoform X2 [Nerophis lumbriciformis]
MTEEEEDEGNVKEKKRRLFSNFHTEFCTKRCGAGSAWFQLLHRRRRRSNPEVCINNCVRIVPMRDEKQQPSSLYLEVCCQDEEARLPLHSSIVFFLLSYCDCNSFKVHLVASEHGNLEALKGQIPECVDVLDMKSEGLPRLVRGCRLPAVLDETGELCRAGLAVVLRHIINKTIEADPSRNDVLALLGFKKTCLKACAEVSKWTRLCEIGIPSAVEDHLRNPSIQTQPPPVSILTLERRLAEPVKVHNDDKIRRQKLQEQRQNEKNDINQADGGRADCDPQSSTPPNGLELRAALAKLSVAAGPSVATRECSEIRKVKTNDLPELEHLFAEGLYFTLTDVVLLPCIHQYLSSLPAPAASTLHHIPHLLRWYSRVQEVPGLLRAAKACGITLVSPEALASCTAGPPQLVEGNPPSQLEHEEETTTQLPFVGGPRPTMTKLKESGIVAAFAPHPCPEWTLPWDSLPEAINPAEGKMSNIRTVKKKQQLNNLVAMVTHLAKPGDTIVDFCSGTGHVGIVLAHTLPHCQVLLIENKEESLIRAQGRSTELGVENIGFIQANLDYFTGPFHIGVALHACGVATDMVMEHCIQAGAAFVISPCCYGFIQNAVKFTFPRSKMFQETLIYKGSSAWAWWTWTAHGLRSRTVTRCR